MPLAFCQMGSNRAGSSDLILHRPNTCLRGTSGSCGSAFPKVANYLRITWISLENHRRNRHLAKSKVRQTEKPLCNHLATCHSGPPLPRTWPSASIEDFYKNNSNLRTPLVQQHVRNQSFEVVSFASPFSTAQQSAERRYNLQELRENSWIPPSRRSRVEPGGIIPMVSTSIACITSSPVRKLRFPL
jgi:hypothetical protein